MGWQIDFDFFPGFGFSCDGFKLVLRHEPQHVEALSSLKELYRRSGKWNALVELLRVELELPESVVVPSTKD